ncbi:hypothetical protein FB566_4848 [Stackebrandtia endophytica]|uniref:Uncharacterized protein n=1 Tax=Stackebrandtia endophytica TaxID=1496996 RepID=A0A543B346_9ACTN|nr:hypothetical protein [Stackebrandtia endophytica]TQL79247.1 hypothetical protein FB566_4848 [Stackebrandtia endophytica]
MSGSPPDDVTPQWCVIATVLPYPYRAGEKQHFRSHGIFPAGAKLYVIGGFAGMGYETVTVIGYGHHRRRPVTAHIQAHHLGGWRAGLVYRPAILRLIAKAEATDLGTSCRWRRGEFDDTSSPEYGEHLAGVAAYFQSEYHGEPR